MPTASDASVPVTDLYVHTARPQQNTQPLTLPPKFSQCPIHLLKEGIKTTCDRLYFNVNCIIKATPMPCPVPQTQKFRELPGGPGSGGAAGERQVPQRPGFSGFLLVVRFKDVEMGFFLIKALLRV